ncbi:NfeD family protein [bacterium 1XD42-8]|jgi:membrane protein implicated in regulation of membrane protease activity|nr:NfeD family protein [Lachnospiraceae bacterium]RKJ52393.1 NfeD family protein [bacterium 1XD42-8]
MDAFIWLAVIVICLIIEAVTLGLTTIWFAGGALIAFIASLFRVPIAIQFFLFFIVSLALLFLTRPIAIKYFNKDRIKTNVDTLIGKQAVVISEINNLKGEGTVILEGKEWTARSNAKHEILEDGMVVKILRIEGVKLIVEKDLEGV